MLRSTAWLLTPLLAAACTNGGPRAGDGSAAAEAEIKRRELASLPAVDTYLAPFDEGRLQVAPPAKWTVLPPLRNYEVGFAQEQDNDLPRILISAEGPPPDSPPELTEANVLEYAVGQDAALAQGAVQRTVVEPNLPIILGETLFVRHVRLARHGKQSGLPVAIQSLQTIRGGRLYKVELIAPIEADHVEDYGLSLVKWRDYGYAVAAHMKFAPPGEKFDPLPEARAKADASAATGLAKAKAAAEAKAKKDAEKATAPPEAKPAATKPAETQPAESKPPAKADDQPKP